jgi:hypothetical protein
MRSFLKIGSESNRMTKRRTRQIILPGLLERLGERVLPATFIVTTNSDAVGGTVEVKYLGNDTWEVPMLRTAIEEANLRPGTDTIQFANSLQGQTITLVADDVFYPTDMGHTALIVLESVTIQGLLPSSGQKGLTIDAASQRRIFGVTPGVTLTLNDITLANGLAQGGVGAPAWFGGGGGGGAGLGGAIYAYQATVNLSNVTITGSQALGGSGGSIWGNAGLAGGGGGSAAFSGGIGASGQLTSSGGGGGGGMYGPGGDANGNSGGLGGLNADSKRAGQDDAGTLGGGGGGGRYYHFGPLVEIAHSGGPATQTNAWGFGGGGGGGAQAYVVYGDAHGGQGGFGGGGGGAGYKGSGNRGGSGGFGGGGGGGTGTSNAGGSLFGGGTGGNAIPNGDGNGGGGGGGAGLGGAIFLNRSTLNVVNSTITNNSANGGAGGGGSEMSWSGNGGSGLGGAIFALNSTTNVQSSTIANNGASSGGNQLYLLSMGSGASSMAYLANSIVARSDLTGSADIAHRAIAGARMPLVGGVANFVSVVGMFPRRAIVATGDPMLASLADNGGATLTIKPLLGSPVIDAGTTRIRPRFGQFPTTDQTRSARLQGVRPDLGSVETQGITAQTWTRFRKRPRV